MRQLGLPENQLKTIRVLSTPELVRFFESRKAHWPGVGP